MFLLNRFSLHFTKPAKNLVGEKPDRVRRGPREGWNAILLMELSTMKLSRTELSAVEVWATEVFAGDVSDSDLFAVELSAMVLYHHRDIRHPFITNRFSKRNHTYTVSRFSLYVKSFSSFSRLLPSFNTNHEMICSKPVRFHLISTVHCI